MQNFRCKRMKNRKKDIEQKEAAEATICPSLQTWKGPAENGHQWELKEVSTLFIISFLFKG